MRSGLCGVAAVVFTAMSTMTGGTALRAQADAAAGSSVALQVDARAATTAFPHFWEQTFGSGRAILSLRQEYRQDLRTVKEATDFQSIRFHGILMDEVG